MTHNETSSNEIVTWLEQMMPGKVRLEKTVGDQLFFEVKTEELANVSKRLQLHSETQFCTLVDIVGVDWLLHSDVPNPVGQWESEENGKNIRFEVIYQLLSIRNSERLFLKVYIEEGEFVPSLSDVYMSAPWWEREVWDMYGIYFVGNPDLRRLLTDYGFEGHPLRKDFPLTGYVEVQYDAVQKRVVYQKVSLAQEYRGFQYRNPWGNSGA